jgi:hypothetical protein
MKKPIVIMEWVKIGNQWTVVNISKTYDKECIPDQHKELHIS